MNTILFDLDGTLLPMVQNDFVERYMGLIGRKAAEWGYEPKELVKALWRGTGAMMGNTGSISNRHCFWDSFARDLGENIRSMEPVIEAFYSREFDAAKDSVTQNPYARKLLDLLRDKGYMLVLATNPLFPPAAVATRLSWINLQTEDFAYITHYGNSYYCKPQAGYFKGILDELGKQPQDCLMVGNSVEEDTGCLNLGIPLYLITDCIEGKGDYDHLNRGSFADFMEYARSLPPVL